MSIVLVLRRPSIYTSFHFTKNFSHLSAKLPHAIQLVYSASFFTSHFKFLKYLLVAVVNIAIFLFHSVFLMKGSLVIFQIIITLFTVLINIRV